MKVFIDAGHGGKDAGAVNGKRYEKDIALKIALKVWGLLEAEGVGVALSRADDRFITLSGRSKRANLLEMNYFISIHCNAAENKTANGIETYYYPGSKEGQQLAQSIQNNLIRKTAAKNRGIKTANFAVLRETKMVAVLVEVGFISNMEECNKLVSESYQKIIAEGIANGVLAMKNK